MTRKQAVGLAIGAAAAGMVMVASGLWTWFGV